MKVPDRVSQRRFIPIGPLARVDSKTPRTYASICGKRTPSCWPFRSRYYRHPSRQVELMSTPPFSRTWPLVAREMADSIGAMLHHARTRGHAGLRTFRVFRRRKLAGISDHTWRIGLGISAVLTPAAVMAMLGPSLPVTTPGIILLIAIAGSTYIADWVGGVTALVVSALVLDLWFIGTRTDLGIPHQFEETAGYIITIFVGVGLVGLIQRLKLESLVDRRAAVAARAAATALASIEAAAASHASGAVSDRDLLHHSLLRAMVSINRAHVGVLLLADAHSTELRTVSTYG